MTAKESKAVASVQRWDPDDSEFGIGMVGDSDGDYVKFKDHQSALHAAEAAYKETERDRRRWAIRAEAAEAELGELRRRVGELVTSLSGLAKHHEVQVGIATDFSRDELLAEWHRGADVAYADAAEKLKLLAAGGGADGDNEGEGK